MEDTFCPVRGDIVSPCELNVRKARDLALRLEAGEIDFARLIECRKDGTRGVVVLDVDVQVPQRRVHAIRARERIAVTFDENDGSVPTVEALRADFPLVPHLNIRSQEYPRSICLFDERYESILRRWTAPRFVFRIREWLALTAEGRLHQDDQPLEPFLLDHAGHIVLPHDLAADEGPTDRLYGTANLSCGGERHFILTDRHPSSEKAWPFVVAVLRCQPQAHGIIHQLPTTFAGLADLVAPAGLDLLEEMRHQLRRWRGEGNAVLDSHPICIIVFPKTRVAGGDVEVEEKWAFMLDGAVRDIGVKLDVWQQQDKQLGLGAVLTPDPSKRGDDIGVRVLNPLSELTRPMAALLNGRSRASEIRIAAVGVGALGSQVVMNFARSGFGTWTLVDDDRLMPHNVARHALSSWFMGWRKAEALAKMANDVCADSTAFSALQADMLSPGERQEDLAAAFRGADVILDMSADVTVARRLACDVDSAGRRLSLFLTPTGKEMVLLAEDK